MDPNENLREQRRLAAKAIESLDNGRIVSELDVQRLAELVITLDEWITRHGALPADWREAQGL